MQIYPANNRAAMQIYPANNHSRLQFSVANIRGVISSVKKTGVGVRNLAKKNQLTGSEF
jgi:hypothetical protein